jgi:tripartite-type tricarboxylate transporter receptor subunit TctC
MTRPATGARGGPARPRRRRALAVLLATVLLPVAQAQEFPKQTLKIIVPFTPGGATDTMARLMAHKLQELWGSPVVVDYKPGAGTVIGVDFVAKAPPDGYTIALVNSAYTVNPTLRKSMPYDTLKDLRGVTQLGIIQSALVARADAPFDNLRQLVAYAQKNPGKLSYGNSGIGSLSHLVMEQLKRQESLAMVTVAFKGGAQVVTELLGGRIDIATEPFLVALPHVKEGKLKLIGTFGDRRVAGYEQLYPTIAETLPGLSASSLLGFVAPAATPRAALLKIAADSARVLAQPDTRKRLEEMGIEALGTTPDKFDEHIRSEIARWGKVVVEAKVGAE